MYTLEVYKADRRRKSGERLISKEDIDVPRGDAQGMAEALEMKGFRVELRDTWVTRVNSQTGREYQERYDTPRSCSPASDLDGSM